MDLLRCYTNDEPKEMPEPREFPNPKKVFGIPRRTKLNLEKTTTKAKKVLKNRYDSEEERHFVL